MTMRPSTCWADLRGATVGVYGLGVEGAANVRMLGTLAARIVLVDDHKREHEGAPVLATDAGGLEALLACDVVVKAPGISRAAASVRTLEANGVAVLGGLGLWFASAPLDRIVAVTGTKGKSTTSAIVGHLLNALGRHTFVGGNIGLPPYGPLAQNDATEFWVIEVSSYQATDIARSPQVVAVTSLHPDHLDWHGSVEQYYTDKLSLCSQPGARLTIAAATSPDLVARADLLGPHVDWVYPDLARRHGWHRALGMRGDHNLDNAEIAARCIRALGVTADDEALEVAAHGFSGLEHRLQTVHTLGEVEFVDDSLSTNVLPTLRAVEAFATRRTALIVGGHDRGIDYRPLGVGLATREAPLLVVTIPPSGARIADALDAGTLPPSVQTTSAADLDDAVAQAHRWAQPDGVVLLSPAAPSFGLYRDYRERGEAFARAARSLTIPHG